MIGLLVFGLVDGRWCWGGSCLYGVGGELVFLFGCFCVVVRLGLYQLLSSALLSLSLPLFAWFRWLWLCEISGGILLSELSLSVGGCGEVGS